MKAEEVMDEDDWGATVDLEIAETAEEEDSKATPESEVAVDANAVIQTNPPLIPINATILKKIDSGLLGSEMQKQAQELDEFDEIKPMIEEYCERKKFPSKHEEFYDEKLGCGTVWNDDADYICDPIPLTFLKNHFLIAN